MSAHSTAIGVSSKRGVWGGGNEPLKASYGKLMMWFFLLSDIFTFAAFLGAAMAPGVCVVIPSRNGRELLERLFASMMPQRPEQIVVVDNGKIVMDGARDAVLAALSGARTACRCAATRTTWPSPKPCRWANGCGGLTKSSGRAMRAAIFKRSSSATSTPANNRLPGEIAAIHRVIRPGDERGAV